MTKALSITFTGDPAALTGTLPACKMSEPETPATSSRKPSKFRLVRKAAGSDKARLEAALALVAGIDLSSDAPGADIATAALELPGMRRRREGRGTQVPDAIHVRAILRYPCLPALAALFPVAHQGRPQMPALVFLAYDAMARRFGSFDRADIVARDLWETVILPELTAMGVRVPQGKEPVSYSAFQKWRKRHVTRERLDALFTVNRAFGVRLAQAVHDSESAWLAGYVGADGLLSKCKPVPPTLRGTVPPAGTPLDAYRSQMIAADGTVLRPPSEVHIDCPLCGRVEVHDEECPYTGDHSLIVNSRATDPESARLHQPGRTAKRKEHGPKKGFQVVIASLSGNRSFSTVILDVEMAPGDIGEIGFAEAIVRGVIDRFPTGHIAAIVYDGAAQPKFHMSMARRYGVPVVNYPSVKVKPKRARKPKATFAPATPPAPPSVAGTTTRTGGHHKGVEVEVHTHHMHPVFHDTAAGPCHHRIVSTDGELYLTDTPGTPGKKAKGARLGDPIPVVGYEAFPQGDGRTEFGVRVTVRIPCRHGDFEHTYEITDLDHPDAHKATGWNSLPAKVRAVTMRSDTFARMYGSRNIAESIFSQLEAMFPIKDRMGSWGEDAQRLDFLGSAIAINALTWAHLLAYDGTI